MRSRITAPQIGQRVWPSTSACRPLRRISAPHRTNKGICATTTRYRVGVDETPITTVGSGFPDKDLTALGLLQSFRQMTKEIRSSTACRMSPCELQPDVLRDHCPERFSNVLQESRVFLDEGPTDFRREVDVAFLLDELEHLRAVENVEQFFELVVR